jgi:branched-chain amino acid transport system substrate-binding protein
MGLKIGMIAKQLKKQKINIQLIHPYETAEDEKILEIGDNSVNGLIYVLPGNPPKTGEYTQLIQKYKSEYDEENMPSYTAESYDAVMLDVNAINEIDGTKEDIKNKLYKVSKEYTGVSGNVTFNKKGDVLKGVLFKQIKDGEVVVSN